MKGLLSAVPLVALLCALVVITEARTANYIRIYQSGRGDGWLQVSQIAAYDVKGRNVALKKPVSASSVYHGTNPISVTDGNLANRNHPSSFHSGRVSPNDFVLINLESAHDIASITYWNRQDCCQWRAGGMRLQLLDSQQRVISTRIMSAGMVQNFNFPSDGDVPADFDENQYLAANPSVLASVLKGTYADGRTEWLYEGRKLTQRAMRLGSNYPQKLPIGWDSNAYLIANPDVQVAVGNKLTLPAVHWLLFGYSEQRCISRAECKARALNAEVAKAQAARKLKEQEDFKLKLAEREKSLLEAKTQHELRKKVDAAIKLMKKEGGEVFYVKGNFTKTSADAACVKYQASLATEIFMQAAWELGADWCNSGWVKAEGTDAVGSQLMTPINAEGLKNQCQNATVIALVKDNKGAIGGAACYGVKPKQTNPVAKDTILAFNSKSYHQPGTGAFLQAGLGIVDFKANVEKQKAEQKRMDQIAKLKAEEDAKSAAQAQAKKDKATTAQAAVVLKAQEKKEALKLTGNLAVVLKKEESKKAAVEAEKKSLPAEQAKNEKCLAAEKIAKASFDSAQRLYDNTAKELVELKKKMDSYANKDEATSKLNDLVIRRDAAKKQLATLLDSQSSQSAECATTKLLLERQKKLMEASQRDLDETIKLAQSIKSKLFQLPLPLTPPTAAPKPVAPEKNVAGSYSKLEAHQKEETNKQAEAIQEKFKADMKAAREKLRKEAAEKIAASEKQRALEKIKKQIADEQAKKGEMNEVLRGLGLPTVEEQAILDKKKADEMKALEAAQKAAEAADEAALQAAKQKEAALNGKEAEIASLKKRKEEELAAERRAKIRAEVEAQEAKNQKPAEKEDTEPGFLSLSEEAGNQQEAFTRSEQMSLISDDEADEAADKTIERVNSLTLASEGDGEAIAL